MNLVFYHLAAATLIGEIRKDGWLVMCAPPSSLPFLFFFLIFIVVPKIDSRPVIGEGMQSKKFAPG